jgi:hypothetical protein
MIVATPHVAHGGVIGRREQEHVAGVAQHDRGASRRQTDVHTEGLEHVG